MTCRHHQDMIHVAPPRFSTRFLGEVIDLVAVYRRPLIHNFVKRKVLILYKVGTMNTRSMRNSKPMKVWKILGANLLCNPLCDVNISIENRLWSSNIHPNRFQMHLEPETLLCECLNQSRALSNSSKIYLCSHIFITSAVLKKCIDFVCLAQKPVHNTDTKKHQK